MFDRKFHRLGPNQGGRTHQIMGQAFVNRTCMAFYIHQARIMEATKGYALHSSPGNDEQESTPNIDPITLIFLGFGRQRLS
jgi:hypothetical protein